MQCMTEKNQSRSATTVTCAVPALKFLARHLSVVRADFRGIRGDWDGATATMMMPPHTVPATRSRLTTLVVLSPNTREKEIDYVTEGTSREDRMIRTFQKTGAGIAARSKSLRTPSLSASSQQQRGIGWVEFVDQKWNPREKKWLSEDPEESVKRIQEEVNSKGVSMTNDPLRSPKARHVKPTTFKKELKDRIAYERKRKEVMDLIKYIQFVKDHKHKDNW